MKLKCDGQGHHPKARLYVPHCIMKLKIKATRGPLPLVLRLAMERLGLGFAKFVRANTIAEREPMFMEAACGAPCLCNVDTDGYGMLQANEAEPPPADGCINALEVSVGETSKKPIFGFLAPLRRIAAVVMVFVSLLASATACHKEPTVEPTKNITMDITWYDIFHNSISKDSVTYYTKQPDVKTVTLELEKGPVDYYTPDVFRRARDNLTPYFKISDKVIGSGTIIVSRLNGAQLPDVNSGLTGMAEVDSIWFASKGFTVKRLGAKKSK